MGLSIKTAARWKNDFEQKIKDIHYRAISYHLSAETILDYLTEQVWHHPHYQQLPPWARGELWGIEKTLADVRYGMTIPVHYLDGKFITSKQVSKGRWKDIPYGVQVWKDRPWKVYILQTTSWYKNEMTGRWEDSGLPAPIVQLPCHNCYTSPWSILCAECLKPLCDGEKCSTQRSPRDPKICHQCALRTPLEQRGA